MMTSVPDSGVQFLNSRPPPTRVADPEIGWAIVVSTLHARAGCDGLDPIDAAAAALHIFFADVFDRGG